MGCCCCYSSSPLEGWALHARTAIEANNVNFFKKRPDESEKAYRSRQHALSSCYINGDQPIHAYAILQKKEDVFLYLMGPEGGWLNPFTNPNEPSILKKRIKDNPDWFYENAKIAGGKILARTKQFLELNNISFSDVEAKAEMKEVRDPSEYVLLK